MLVATIAAFAAFIPATASANVSSTLDQVFADPTPGAHSVYTNVQTFTPSETAPHDDDDDLRKWILDGPAGMYGNPNAVPFASRCTLAQFNTHIDPGSDGAPPFFNACPNESIVGIAGVVMRQDSDDAEIDLNGAAPNLGAFAAINPSFASAIPAGMDNASPGTIYLLQTTPEVPVTLASLFHLNASRTQSVLAPVTSGADGDFRIRVIPTEDTPHQAPDLDGPGPGAAIPAYVYKIMQRLHGAAGNGVNWLTNPTRCGTWTGYSYATEYDLAGNTNADSQPDPDEGPVYKKSAPSDVAVGCPSTLPFGPTVSTDLSTTKRDSNPALTVTITNGSDGVDLPKTVVNTLPASVTTDLQGITNLCTIAQRDANACPAASKVGTVSIETPMITAGLAGDVYITTSAGSDAIPDLAVFVTGAISFRLDATTAFVGARNNQIQTTFDNLPQVPFTKFTLTIAGGTDTLLTVSKCPDDSGVPEDGPISYSLTGWSGQAVASAVSPVFEDCFGVEPLRRLSRCVSKTLKVSPIYESRAGLMKSELWVKNRKTKRYKKIKTVKTGTFRFNVKLSSKKYKRGTYRYKVRAVYKATPANPSPVVLQRYSKFKKC